MELGQLMFGTDNVGEHDGDWAPPKEWHLIVAECLTSIPAATQSEGDPR